MDVSQDTSQDIAVIGMACRFPGGSTSPSKLWDFLQQGRSALADFPSGRFNIDAFYHPHAERQGTINNRGGHFLDGDIAEFDAPFFSLTAKEVVAMDPQQRMLLELAYEGLESAGIPIETLPKSKTSCIVGSFMKDYELICSRDPDNDVLYGATGNEIAIMSNRISWFFDLAGPSLTLDTGCSASLVALHLACQSLRTGETNLGIVGGSGLILSPNAMFSMSGLHFLSPDSRCHSFDHRANGYGRGEGVATVIVKRLQDAIDDNDPIRAVIRGTGVNQDGHTAGIILPSRERQGDLMRSVYASAGLEVDRTAYFEGHGTGTQAGDPLETGAIGDVFGESRDADNPMIVGSVKTNIGHLEGCAGLAALIKTILILEHGQIPKNLWFEKGNPKILFDEWKIKIPTELIPWPREGLRRASVNSFGFGGTSAHMIVEDVQHSLQERRLCRSNTSIRSRTSSDSAVDVDSFDSEECTISESRYKQEQSLKLLVWSSHEQDGVKRMLRAYGEHLSNHKDLKLADLAYTLDSRRSALPWKTCLVSGNANNACEAIQNGDYPKALRSAETPKLAFLFGGQGAQWHAMGRELMDYPVFRNSLVKASSHIRSLGADWSLIEELLKDGKQSRVHQPELSQPLCTALQIALVDLMLYFNIKPSAVLGHSSGEIAAAFCAGVLGREQAWAIAYYRGIATRNLHTVAPSLQGAMMSVGLPEEEVEPLLAGIKCGQAVIACVNSPTNVTVSGDKAAIVELEAVLKSKDIFTRILRVQTGYHSPHMHHVAKQYLEFLEEYDATHAANWDNEIQVPMFSSVTGKYIAAIAIDSAYWVENMLSQVRFLHATESVLASRQNGVKIDGFLELGPSATLQAPLKQTLDHYKSGKYSYHSALNRKSNAVESTLMMAGSLWMSGSPIDLRRVNEPKMTGTRTVLVDLPTYAWNHRKTYWHESWISKAYRFRKYPRLDLLGAPSTESTLSNMFWKNFLRLSENPWMQDHKIQGTVLYPAAGMIVMALEAARQISDGEEVQGFEIRNVMIGTALIVPQTADGIETSVNVKPLGTGSKQNPDSYAFTISSLASADQYQEHCQGTFSIHFGKGSNDLSGWTRYCESYHQAQISCTEVRAPKQLYEGLENVGLIYGPSFRCIEAIQVGTDVGCAEIRIPDTKSTMPEKFEYPHLLHPATLDGVFQTIFLAGSEAMVPTRVERIYVDSAFPSGAGKSLFGYSTSKTNGLRESLGTAVMSDEDWAAPRLILEGVHCTKLEASTSGDGAAVYLSNTRNLCSSTVWKEDIDLLSNAQATQILEATARQAELPTLQTLVELQMGAVIYIRRALNHIDNSNTRVDSEYLQCFLRWMREQYHLVENRLLPHQNHSADDWLSLPQDVEEAVLGRVATNTIDGKLLSAIGRELPAIISGQTDPLETLLNDELLSKYYSQNIGMTYTALEVAEYISRAAHKRPDMKILEIGAGTGSSTMHILETLDGIQGTPRFDHFTFTDISPALFDQAQQRFARWTPYMTFRRLDIDEDPVKQGFQEGSFDLIVAGNVFHATKSIDKTLQHAARLLKSNGKLLMLEVTSPLLGVGLIYGVLPGWWVGEEDGRHGGPTLSEEQWDTSFRRNGFSGTDLALHDFELEQHRSLTMMVATKSSLAQKPLAQEMVFILAHEPSHFAKSLAALTQERLSRSAAVSQIRQLPVDASFVRGKLLICLLEIDQPFTSNMSGESMESFKALVLESAGCLWVTQGAYMGSSNPSGGAVQGAFRVLRSEDSQRALYTLDLANNPPSHDGIRVEVIEMCLHQAFGCSQASEEFDYAENKGVLCIPRLDVHHDINSLIESRAVQPELKPWLDDSRRPLKLQIGKLAELDSFYLDDDPAILCEIGPEEVEIEVKSVGLSHTDILTASGQTSHTEFGTDAAGLVSRIGRNVHDLRVGDRVAAVAFGSCKTFFRSPNSMVQKIPDSLSFVSAASLPTSLTLAYYALVEFGRAGPGDAILINAAASETGQVAIQLAQHLDLSVIVVVNSATEKELLIEKYGCTDATILYHQSHWLVECVQNLTAQRGADIVLDLVATDASSNLRSCVADFGRYVAVGDNNARETAFTGKNISYTNIDLHSLIQVQPARAGQLFKKACLLRDEIKIHPAVPLRTFSPSTIAEAFMALSELRGKVVIETNGKDLIPVAPTSRDDLNLRPGVTYIFAGGLGGVGKSIAKFLVASGAKHIAFLSRSGATKDEVKAFLQSMTAEGVSTRALACDISNRQQLESAIAAIRATMPPIKGVLQGAAVVRDGILENMSHDQFQAATRPKIQGSWNLHEALHEDLDFFVFLSSAAGSMGTRGQINYAAGNSYMAALSHHRRSLGLPAVCLDLCMILGVGMVAEDDRTLEILKSSGFFGIDEATMLKLVKVAIMGRVRGKDVPAVVVVGVGTGGIVKQNGVEDPYWFRDNRFTYLKRIDLQLLAAEGTSSGDGAANTLKADLINTTTAAEATAICEVGLITKLAKSLSVPTEDLDPGKAVSTYGVDSLVAVEIRNWILREIGADVSVFDILSPTPIRMLAGDIARKCSLLGDGVKEEFRDMAVDGEGAA